MLSLESLQRQMHVMQCTSSVDVTYCIFAAQVIMVVRCAKSGWKLANASQLLATTSLAVWLSGRTACSEEHDVCGCALNFSTAWIWLAQNALQNILLLCEGS